MLTSLTGTLICGFVPWTICNAIYTQDGTPAAGHAVIAFIFIASAFYATTWNGILTGYTVECMSYDIRSKLVVTQNFLVQGSITMWNYVNPIALEHISWVSDRTESFNVNPIFKPVSLISFVILFRNTISSSTSSSSCQSLAYISLIPRRLALHSKKSAPFSMARKLCEMTCW